MYLWTEPKLKHERWPVYGPAMGDFVLYQAVHSYTPLAQGELALEVDDLLEIQGHRGDHGLPPKNGEAVAPNGWLHAFNRRSGVEGYVPSTYVKQLSSNGEVLRRTAPPRLSPFHSVPGGIADEAETEESAYVAFNGPGSELDNAGCAQTPNSTGSFKSPSADKGTPRKTSHRTTGVFFHTPILCRHCNDYIWGAGKVGVRCEGECLANYFSVIV